MDASTVSQAGTRPARPDRWLVATGVASVAAFALLMFLGRQLTFYWDEWTFIRIPGLGTPADWFAPHNEHWSTLPFLLYKATFAVVGLHSYLPYLAELLVIHLLAVAGVAALVRRDLGPAAGFVAVLPLLVLGAGWQNLLWAFQTGFVGSTALGIWALYALDTPGRKATVAGALLLVASLMCSGIGLIWLAGATIELLLDPARRHRLVAVLPAVASYAVWHVAFGAGAVARDEGAANSLRYYAIEVPKFIAQGVATAAGAFSGFGRVTGLIGFGVLALAAVTLLIRRRTAPRAVAMLIAILLMYGVIGLVRARYGAEYAVQSRYIYVAAFMLVLAVSAILAGLLAAGRLTRTLRLLMVGLAAVSVVAGLVPLRDGRNHLAALAANTRIYIGEALSHAGAPWVDATRDWHSVPLAGEVPGFVAAYGDPRQDTLFPWFVGSPRQGGVDGALVLLMGGSFRSVPGSPPADPLPVVLSAADKADLAQTGSCLRASSTATGGFVTVSVPAGGSVALTPTATGEASAQIGRNGSQPAKTRIVVPLEAGVTAAIQVPDTGDGTWQVRVNLPPDPVTLCVGPAPG